MAASSVLAKSVGAISNVADALYFEAQRGDMCRMHAVNMVIGRDAVHESSFREFGTAFAREYKCDVEVMEHAVQSNGLCLMGYTVEACTRLTAATFMSPPLRSDSTQRGPLDAYLKSIVDACTPRAILFSRDHAYATVFHNGKYWLMDSTRGTPSAFDTLPAFHAHVDNSHGCVLFFDTASARAHLLKYYALRIAHDIGERSLNAWVEHAVRERDVIGTLDPLFHRFLHVWSRVNNDESLATLEYTIREMPPTMFNDVAFLHTVVKPVLALALAVARSPRH